MTTFIQPSFAKGELGPELYGRVDTAAYQVGMRTLKNCIVHPYGGTSNRAGLQYIGPVRNHNDGPIRLIKFQFSTTDVYELEFGNQYMRVIRNDAHVTNAPVAITGITNANPAVVTATAHGLADQDEVSIDGVLGMQEINGRRYVVDVLTANTFAIYDQVDRVTGINSTGYGVYTSGGAMAEIYEVATPYLLAELPQLKYVQSADVMTLTHNMHPTQELSRTAHNNWTFATINLGPLIPRPTGLGVTVNGTTGSTTYQYAVTALDDTTGEESLTALVTTVRAITGITKANPAVVTSAGHGYANGQTIELNGIVGMTDLNGTRATVGGVTTNTYQLVGVDSTSFNTYVSGGNTNATYITVTNGNAVANNTISWTAVAGAGSYIVYKFFLGAWGLIGQTSNTNFLDSNIAADSSRSIPQAKNPFVGAGNYPNTASYYEQRRVFGGTLNRPDTSFYSQTGNQSNFNVSNPVQDDDAITATLYAREVNEIRHYVPGNDLLAFTSGSEWRINSGPDSFFSANTIKQKPQSTWGIAHLRPLDAGETTIFVEDNRQRVRSFGYSFQLDGYTGTGLSLLAPHIFQNNLTLDDWTFARSPDPRMYGIRSDGVAVTMTFDKDQDVVAWTRWVTDGFFETVDSVRNPTTMPGIEDGVYFIVKRKVNGRTVRYIEKLHSRQFSKVEDCFFVDSGLSFNNPLFISDVSLANPGVVTSAAHGLSNGDTVDVRGIQWMPIVDNLDNETQPTQLNGFRYTVANVTTDTLTLVDDDGNGVDTSAFLDYVTGGSLRIPTTAVRGLDHIEGKDVSVLADGNVEEGLSVSGGIVHLPRAASIIHVGLKYTADFETLNIEQAQGTIQGRPKKISWVVLRLQNSRGLFVGVRPEKLVEMKQREFEVMGAPTALLSGDKKIVLLPEWNSFGRVFIRQRYPLPLTILAIIPDLEIGLTAASLSA